MYLAYLPDSIWDELYSDSGIRSSLYRIQTSWVSYGSFAGYDGTDYYQIAPGIGSFRLIVTSDSTNSYGYAGTWGQYNSYFDVKITDEYGAILLSTNGNPDLYTDTIAFTSSSNATYYVEIRNSLFSSFN